MSSSHEWLVCPRSQSALERLEGFLESAVASQDLQLRVLALYLISQGGKRLRPCLVFLGAACGQWDENKLLAAAAALELIHVASLYHDDVMDRATLRRNVPSANARWGNCLAALAGTYVVARAIATLGRLGSVANQLTSQASLALATGQLMEVENAYNLALTEPLHLEILRRKTATLFELPLRLGALLSGASAAHSEALAAYGRNLGLAFQLVDDALDLTGNKGALGKETGTDLREGVYSLAVLRGLDPGCSASERLRAILGQAFLSERDIQTVKRIIDEAGLVPGALRLAENLIRAAQAELQSLPEGPARESLHHLAEFTLRRTS